METAPTVDPLLLEALLVDEMLSRVKAAPRAEYERRKAEVIAGVAAFMGDPVLAEAIASEVALASSEGAPVGLHYLVGRVSHALAERLGLPPDPLPTYSNR